MTATVPPGGRISASRLAILLGDWRRSGSRRGASDLAAAVELQVRDGQLPPGTRLPAERELTAALGVSRTLVGAALDRLRDHGLVASRQGAGTWITARPGTGLNPEESAQGGLIDLAHASPPAADGVQRAVEAALPRLTSELLDHGYSVRGLPELRERIAERYTARGLPTTPAQILVTNGAHHAFALLLRALAGPGDRVLVEQPCYPNTPEAIRAAHALPVPVAVDAHAGWDLTGIEAALRQAAPRLAYFVVDFQNPTGLRMPAAERQRLGDLLARGRTMAVADETHAELDYEGDPADGPPPLGAFAGDWVVTVGSAAKSHWGGLRIGWLRASEELVERIVSVRFSLDLGSPVLEQLVLAELLREPDAVLRGRRDELRGLRDVLMEAVREQFPEWTFRVPGGGLSLWCRLPGPMSTRLSVAAASRGLQLAPGSRFGVHGGLERWLRLPFSLPSGVLREATRRLAEAAGAVGTTPVVAEAGADVTVT